MAKDHGPSVKDDKQYEGLREEGHEQVQGGRDLATRPARRAGAARAAARAAAAAAAGSGSGGNQAQKKAAGRKGGKKSS